MARCARPETLFTRLIEGSEQNLIDQKYQELNLLEKSIKHLLCHKTRFAGIPPVYCTVTVSEGLIMTEDPGSFLRG